MSWFFQYMHQLRHSWHWQRMWTFVSHRWSVIPWSFQIMQLQQNPRPRNSTSQNFHCKQRQEMKSNMLCSLPRAMLFTNHRPWLGMRSVFTETEFNFICFCLYCYDDVYRFVKVIVQCSLNDHDSLIGSVKLSWTLKFIFNVKHVFGSRNLWNMGIKNVKWS